MIASVVKRLYLADPNQKDAPHKRSNRKPLTFPRSGSVCNNPGSTIFGPSACLGLAFATKVKEAADGLTVRDQLKLQPCDPSSELRIGVDVSPDAFRLAFSVRVKRIRVGISYRAFLLSRRFHKSGTTPTCASLGLCR